MAWDTEHLNGKEFNGRAIIADGRNGESPILVRGLQVCKPTGSPNSRPSSGSSGDGSSGGTAGAFTPPEIPLYATGGPVSYPDSSMFSSPASAMSSSFSQVGPSSYTSSSYSSSSPQQDVRPREYQCLIPLPAARELMMPRCFAQQDDYSMSINCSSFMTSPDMSFSQGHISGYDPLMAPTSSGGFPHPTPYGFDAVHTVQPQAFMPAYPMSSDGTQVLYGAPTSYAVQPPAYNDYYPPANTAALTSQMSNMNIASGAGGVVFTEQRGVHIRDISRRASEDQIRKMIREVTGPEAAASIETIKVPVQDGGAPRGHAFVHFRNASLARRLVDYLNGQEFKGRKLQVRLMKEGDAINGSSGGASFTTATATTTSSASSSSKHRSAGKHHGSHHAGGSSDRKQSERKDRDRPEKSSTSKAAPLVVGTPATALASSSSKEKHGKKPSSVVIADGSSGRRTSDGR